MSEAAYGIGAYTLPEAARLLGGVGAGTLRRWVFGYSYERDEARIQQPPLWRSQYASQRESAPLIGFRDLIEARIVRSLRKTGIGLPTIRHCLERAREIVGSDHPFGTSRFRTDGKEIFLEITKDADEPQLENLKRRQMVFNRMVAPSFVDLDFDDDAAVRWWLLPHKRSILIDPQICFGQPTVAGHGVKTETLAQAVKAEGSVAKVAQMYGVDRSLVRDAVAFESKRQSTATM